MKISLAILFIIFFNYKSHAISQLDSLVLSDGTVIKKGQMIKLGSPSSPEGHYLSVRLSRKSFYKGSIIMENSLDRNLLANQGYKYELKRINIYGNKKKGFKIVGLIWIGLLKFDIDLENAVKTKEIEL